MRKPRRNHSPKFKAQVALEAIRGEKTIADCQWSFSFPHLAVIENSPPQRVLMKMVPPGLSLPDHRLEFVLMGHEFYHVSVPRSALAWNPVAAAE